MPRKKSLLCASNERIVEVPQRPPDSPTYYSSDSLSCSVQGLEEKAAEMDRSDPGGPKDHRAGAFKKAAGEIRKCPIAIKSGKQALVNPHPQTFSIHRAAGCGMTLSLSAGVPKPATHTLNYAQLSTFQAGSLNPQPQPST